MATVKNIDVKKQTEKPISSGVSKPKAESSKEDIKVFGSLSTSAKTSSKSSDVLSERLQSAQNKEVKRDDAQVSTPIFGSLTGVQPTSAKVDGASIFGNKDSKPSVQEDINEVKASDVAATEEAIERESVQTGKRFDSDNFASTDAPMRESAGCGAKRGGNPGKTISVTRPNTHSNNVIDTYNRYSSGKSRSAFLNQRQRDFDEVMSLELNTSASSAGSKSSNLSSGVSSGGSGGGCSGGGSYDCGSGHHKSGVNWGKVLAWGAGSLAIGALGAYGISALVGSAAKKAASAGAEATAPNGNNASSGSVSAEGMTSAAAAVPAASMSGTTSANNNAPQSINGICGENKSVISDLKKATPETAPQVLAKADAQYGNMSGAITQKEGELSTTNSNLGKTQGELKTIEGQSQECAANIESTNGIINEKKEQVTKQGEFIQSLTKQKDEYTQKANNLGTKITEKETAIGEYNTTISSLESQLSTITDSATRSSITAQLNAKRAEKQKLETEKGKLEGEKQSYEDKANQLEQNDIPQAEKVKTTLENDEATAEEKKQALEQQLTQYKQQQDGLVMREGELNGQIKTIEGQQKTLNNDMKTLNDAREDLARQMNSTFQGECRDRSWVSRAANSSAGNDYTIGAATRSLNSAAAAATPTETPTAAQTTVNATVNLAGMPASATALAQGAPALVQTATQGGNAANGTNGAGTTAETPSASEAPQNKDAALIEKIRNASGDTIEEKIRNSKVDVSEEWVTKNKAALEAE